MNPIAELALARALARGATPVPAAAVLPVAPLQGEPVLIAPVQGRDGHESHALYLEGRRHAIGILSGSSQLLEVPGGAKQLADRLRQCMQGKPKSFAMGMAGVIELLEKEVRRG